MKNKFINTLEQNPIIAALSDFNSLDAVISSETDIVFFLCGSIFNLKEAVAKVKASGKLVFVHFDLIEGYAKDTVGLDYLIEGVAPDGIISTKSSIIKRGKEKGLYVIQRLFLLDSINLNSGILSVKSNNPDAVEILPGAMPKITQIVVDQTRKPVITGGLILDKEDVIHSLKAGAMGISTSNMDLWQL